MSKIRKMDNMYHTRHMLLRIAQDCEYYAKMLNANKDVHESDIVALREYIDYLLPKQVESAKSTY